MKYVEGERFEAYFKQLLISKVIARIDFEYEHMIDTGSAPTIRIDTDEDHLQNDEKGASIELDGYFPVERELVVFEVAQENCNKYSGEQ